MHNPDAIGQFRRRLVELGCPEPQLRRLVEETADHHEDLKLASLDDGYSKSEAEARANAQLGDPSRLAERAVAGLRHSSWWGRHRIIGFCLLPPLGFIATWLLSILFCATVAAITERFSPKLSDACSTAFNSELRNSHALLLMLNLALNGGVIALVALLWCRFAQKSAAGLKWAMIACFVCSVEGVFFHATLMPHWLSIGFSRHPNWASMAGPLLVAGIAFLWQKQRESRVNLLETQAG